ncbi:nitrogen fixation protein FixH [Albidovulum inexpectatum]|uniref:Nitrogen fixation protein FixH n=1 Tax=Albidovulum inexpectatum TaxID=196587 RepID=A0A2S5JKU5_9RHOB|nr:FixH family protein [Albidovulum inexpectatum]PPB82177.1 nitrogen fixation protein FixH [Albidovulum inexpectatum]
MKGELTGRKVLFITVAAFGIIIAVNVVMAYLAIRTFPGLEVKNSYVASQVFDAERRAQEALGWNLEHAYENGMLRLSFRDRAGQPVRVRDLSVTVGRTTMAAQDRQPEFVWNNGDYVARADLAPGKWMLLLEAHAEDGTKFRQRLDLFVRG